MHNSCQQRPSHFSYSILGSTGFALAALVSYKNLEKSVNHSFQHLSGHQENGVDPNYQVYSKVVSVVVSNPSTELLDKPITITLRHLQVGH